MSISENFYPTVLGESVFGDFEEALSHLHKQLIATKEYNTKNHFFFI